MSDYNFLKTAKVEVPKRSGFDKSYKNLFTLPVGTLVPALCDEIIPNTKIDLKAAFNACLPPLASDTFMNVKLKAEAFFVPSRLLYGGQEAWWTGEKLTDGAGNEHPVTIPTVEIQSNVPAFYRPGTLSDYLGFKISKSGLDAFSSVTPIQFMKVNYGPFFAYHKIYDDWYRNPRIQKKLFMPPVAGLGPGNSGYTNPGFLPYLSLSGNTSYLLGSPFADGVYLGSLRQRNFDIDYFTTATPNAQAGSASSVSIVTTGATGNMTISALRAANSIQQFLERQNIAGTRYVDYVKAHYGAYLPAGVAQRTVFLGSGSIDIYTKGIFQSNSDQGTQTNNPFSTVGAQYGNASANGIINLVNDFTAMEHGYLMVLVSIVPKVTYSNGVNRMLMHYTAQNSQSDCATPLLQNVGQQPIYADELSDITAIQQPGTVFGYTDRYAEFMTREDELHGLVRDGYDLQSFALQRTTQQSPSINTSFLQIPRTYLDQVAASSDGISGYGAWVDSYFDYKVAQPLQKYCIPSLQDPSYEHGDTVEIQRGGTHL